MVLARTVLCLSILAMTSASAQDGSGAERGNVAVTTVTLATGGLAEVRGTMTDPATHMRLSIERGQVADVLRTLVVTGDAAVVSIDLPAAEPVGARSVTGRLLEGDLSDPKTLLGALLGEEVSLRSGANQLSGRLLAYADATIPGDEDTPDRPAIRVSVGTADGRLAYATFPASDPITVEGDTVDERLRELIPALAERVDDARRELSVTLADRARAGFTFVVPTTVWRPSYRALIDDEGDVSLQGWATLENTTGFDWNDVALRLAVGTPVAYAQDVYVPLRVRRPEAPFEVGRTVETGVPEPSPPRGAAAVESAGLAMFRAAPTGMAEAAAMDAEADLVTGAATVGTASTVFSVPGTISLDAGRTLTVPFLSRSRDVGRVTYVDLRRGTDAMDALELAFDPDATVPGGLVAVYDADGFVGDARFGGARGGEARLLPFAVSADVSLSTRGTQERAIARARFRDGALVVTRTLENRTVLSVDAVGATTLVADLARAPDESFAIAEGDGSVEIIDARTARVRAQLAAGTSSLAIVGTRPITERYVIGSLPTAIVEDVLSVGGAVDEETSARLREIAALSAELDGIGRQIVTVEREVEALREAIETDRRNLEAIDVRTPEGAAVRERIVRRTNELDTLLTRRRELERDRLVVENELRR